MPTSMQRLPLAEELASVVLALVLNWSAPGKEFRLSDRVERARLPAWSEISKSLASLGCAVDLRAAVAEPLQKLGLVDVHTSDRGGAYVRGDVGVGT
ncbi:hypothetical protein C5142_00555 [Rhodococcus sp. BGS-1C]|uniref:hypothetical protein n=1 Tax=unclassified Rhodococcus (in: high G+C Gram-positive bacteria) TaxID=192944 RepID=UPI001300FEFE|nr:hypothetical protein [Rhodococcus sp. KRD197]